jgi:hypothetical protein
MLFERADDAEPIQVTPSMRLVVGFSLAMVLAIAIYAEPFIRLATESAQLLLAAKF